MDRLAQFRQILRPLRPGRLVNLGTGHGKFAMLAEGLGWEVTGVDARTQRLPQSNTIEWVESDVRRFPLDGSTASVYWALLPLDGR